jgi:hypothetical protein
MVASFLEKPREKRRSQSQVSNPGNDQPPNSNIANEKLPPNQHVCNSESFQQVAAMGREELKAYFLAKKDELSIVVRDKGQDLRRLEAQRNELNTKGNRPPPPAHKVFNINTFPVSAPPA